MSVERVIIKFVLVLAVLSPLVVAASDPSTSKPPALPAGLPFSVEFGEGSSSSVVVIAHDGKRYEIDTATKTVRELDATYSSSKEGTTAQSSTNDSNQKANSTTRQGKEASDANAGRSYVPGDERLLTLPSGQRIKRGDIWVNFTHRFPQSSSFRGPAQGHTLLGMDDFGLPSFGFQFGLTNRLSAAVYRSPSLIGRPIEFRVGYRLLDETEGKPFNATFRFSVDGENDFQRNFTTNFELIASRSITKHAQLVLVPTVSIHNRPALNLFNVISAPPLYQPCSQAFANGVPRTMNVKPCVDTMSLGIGLSVDIRPTVALIAETDPTLVNARDLGIHRPPVGFAIQKKIWRHSFTFGFTTAPGTTVSQRSQTRAIYFRDPSADRFSGLSVGFNLSRELR